MFSSLDLAKTAAREVAHLERWIQGSVLRCRWWAFAVLSVPLHSFAQQASIDVQALLHPQATVNRTLTPEEVKAIPAAVIDAAARVQLAPVDLSVVSLRGVSRAVTTSARCASGYVTNTKSSASAPDVTISPEQRLDCDAKGCRAVQVTARRASSSTFDLNVSVTCSG